LWTCRYTISFCTVKKTQKKVENSFALFEKNRYICSVHAESVRGTTYGKKLVEALCFILVLET